MKHAVRNILIGGGVLLITLITAVNMIAVPMSAVLPPDPAMIIELPDGATLRLDALVEAFAAEIPADLGTDPEAAAEALPDLQRLPERPEDLTSAEVRELMRSLHERYTGARPPGKDLFSLAEWNRHNGNLDQAQALYESVGEDDPKWSLARRRLAWDVYTKGHKTPARGVAYAHQSLQSDPLDGNAWQDAARVYAATLRIPVDL